MDRDYGILERIVNLLSEKGMDQKDVIKYLNLPRGTFSNWIRKKSYSYYDYLSEIADYLGVSIKYLTTGTDENYISEIKSCITEEDLELIKMINELDPNARRTIRDMILLVHG